MQLATIEMDVDEAKERLAEYQASLARDRNRQDEQIARGYRTLARGLGVIRLSESIHAGGYFDTNGLPRIAVARANSQDCWIEHEGSHDFVYMTESPRGGTQWYNLGALVNPVSVRVTLPGSPEWQRGHEPRAHTIMPIIPPHLRPNPRRLHNFHILWEVEQWDLTPPHDPALIRHIGGDLWAVHAVWDLTELERAVLQR